jgi:AbrB family looped-hinge helix DNA binding protein
MAGFKATMSTKGQLTLPKHVCDALGLAPGTPVEGTVDRHGNIVLLAARSDPTELFATRPPFDRVLSVEDMDRVIARAARSAVPKPRRSRKRGRA